METTPTSFSFSTTENKEKGKTTHTPIFRHLFLPHQPSLLPPPPTHHPQTILRPAPYIQKRSLPARFPSDVFSSNYSSMIPSHTPIVP